MKTLLSFDQYAAWCRMSQPGPHFPAGRDYGRNADTVPCAGDETECPSTLKSAGDKVVITPTPRGSK